MNYIPPFYSEICETGRPKPRFLSRVAISELRRALYRNTVLACGLCVSVIASHSCIVFKQLTIKAKFHYAIWFEPIA